METLKTINETATAILLHLVELAKAEDNAIKIDNNKCFMALCVEIIVPDGILSGNFTGYKVASLAHYGEQNGDLMRDPEMCFLIKDERCIPYYFRNDYVGKETELIAISDGFTPIAFSTVEQRIYSGMVEFAELWLSNIKCQQELKI